MTYGVIYPNLNISVQMLSVCNQGVTRQVVQQVSSIKHDGGWYKWLWGGGIHNWYIQKPNVMTINKLCACKLMDFILTAVKISQIIFSDFSDSTFF